MSKDLKELRERKEELLLESEINRQIIALETGQLKLKAVEWRHSLAKAGAVYKWVAPLAGVGLGFFAARKQVKKAQHQNGHGRHSKFTYLSLLGPLGSTVVRQGIRLWQQSRQRAHANGSAAD